MMKVDEKIFFSNNPSHQKLAYEYADGMVKYVNEHPEHAEKVANKLDKLWDEIGRKNSSDHMRNVCRSFVCSAYFTITGNNLSLIKIGQGKLEPPKPVVTPEQEVTEFVYDYSDDDGDDQKAGIVESKSGVDVVVGKKRGRPRKVKDDEISIVKGQADKIAREAVAGA